MMHNVLVIAETKSKKPVTILRRRKAVGSTSSSTTTQSKKKRSPIQIVEGGKKMVLVDAAEYSSLLETVHVLSTPANVKRLMKGLADYEAGKKLEHPLCD